MRHSASAASVQFCSFRLVPFPVLLCKSRAATRGRVTQLRRRVFQAVCKASLQRAILFLPFLHALPPALAYASLVSFSKTQLMAPVEVITLFFAAYLPAHSFRARAATPAICLSSACRCGWSLHLPAPARPTAARSCRSASELCMRFFCIVYACLPAVFVRALVFTPAPGPAPACPAKRLSRCGTTHLRPG